MTPHSNAAVANIIIDGSVASKSPIESCGDLTREPHVMVLFSFCRQLHKALPLDPKHDKLLMGWQVLREPDAVFDGWKMGCAQNSSSSDLLKVKDDLVVLRSVGYSPKPLREQHSDSSFYISIINPGAGTSTSRSKPINNPNCSLPFSF